VGRDDIEPGRNSHHAHERARKRKGAHGDRHLLHCVCNELETRHPEHSSCSTTPKPCNGSEDANFTLVNICWCTFMYVCLYVCVNGSKHTTQNMSLAAPHTQHAMIPIHVGGHLYEYLFAIFMYMHVCALHILPNPDQASR